MATTQKFYLHAATSTDSGTLPGTSTSLSGTTSSVTPSIFNRSMDGSVGPVVGSASLSTLNSTSPQKNWFERFLSAPLAAQTIASGTWTFSLAANESNTNSAFFPTGAIFTWRPGTGATVGTVVALAAKTSLASGTMGTGATAMTQTFSGSSLAILDGDILVFEAWGSNTQGMATSYLNVLYYDGTAEGSAADNAAYLNAPSALTLYAGGGAAFVAEPYLPVPGRQAVARAGTY